MTYADGAKDTKTHRRRRARRRGRDRPDDHGDARPRPARAPAAPTRVPSRVTLTATDAAGGSRRRHDRVPRQRRRLDRRTTGPIRREQPGDVPDRVPLDRPHRQRGGDQVGQRSRSRSPENCPTNFNDEFDGPALDAEVAGPARRRGRAALRGRRAADEGPQRRHDRRPGHGAERAAAGRARPGQLADPDQARRLDAHRRGRAGRLRPLAGREPEHVREDHLHLQGHASRSTSGWPRATTRPRSRPGRRSRTPDGDVWLRVSTNGSGTYIAEGSTNGENWQQIAGPDHQPRRPGDDEVRPQGLRRRELGRTTPRSTGSASTARTACRRRRRRRSAERRTASWAGTRPRRRSTLTADDGALGEVAKIAVPRRRRRAAHLRGAVHGRRRRASTSSSTSPRTRPENVEAAQAARVPRRRHGARDRGHDDGDRRRPARRRSRSTRPTATRARARC